MNKDNIKKAVKILNDYAEWSEIEEAITIIQEELDKPERKPAACVTAGNEMVPIINTMTRIRNDESYGGGSGKCIYKSDAFRVVHWYMREGQLTDIECKLGDFDIRIDGHHNFTSDSSCMQQLTADEILEIIEHQKKESFRAGMKAKAKQIREALLLD